MSKKKSPEGLTGTPEYDELIRVRREAKEQVEKAGRNAVAALFKNFFTTNPEVTGVGWAQYTPYFNDGDPCEFGVGGFYYTTQKNVDFEHTDIHDDETDGWQVTYGSDRGVPKRQREIREAVNGLLRAVDEDVFEAAFGDHVQVVAVPTGFHIIEYSHD